MVLAVDSNLLSQLAQSGRTSHNELLYLALLMALWLLLRVQRAERSAARPQRRAPANMHELGLVVFQTARAQDIEAFRGLFLAGREAHMVFGENAARYLERRDRATLAELWRLRDAPVTGDGSVPLPADAVTEAVASK